MDVFKRLGWFFVPFLLILLGLAGCTMAEEVVYRRWSLEPNVAHCEERVTQTEDGTLILRRTSHFDLFALANVGFAFGGTLVQGAVGLVDAILTPFGLGDLIASTEPSVRPLPPVKAAP